MIIISLLLFINAEVHNDTAHTVVLPDLRAKFESCENGTECEGRTKEGEEEE